MTTSTPMPNGTSLKSAASRIAGALDQSIQMVGHLCGHINSIAEDAHRDGMAIAQESRELASSVNHKFLLASRGVKASPKALRITGQLLGIAVRYRLEEGRRQANATGASERLEALHQNCAESVRRLCEEQRGATLKLGQFLSMRPDLLPAAYIRELSELRDRVPPLPFAEIEGQLQEAFATPLNEVFAQVDEIATAAASLAQVHRATGLLGQDYAVKVQVPKAHEQVMADIAILRAIAAALPPDSLPFDIRTTLEQIADSVAAELDYQQEAHHCEKLAELMAATPGVEVPGLAKELCTERVLTMQWMQGLPLDKALVAADLERRRQILTRLVRCFAQQIFDFGYFHADPHAGNILVREDDAAPEGFCLVLLDFGCVQALSSDVRDGYSALLRAVFVRDSSAVRASLNALGFEQEGNDTAALEAMTEAMLAPLQRDGALQEWARDPKAATKALMELTQSVPGLKTPRHFVLLGRVLATLGGILIEHSDAGVSLPAIVATELARAQSSSVR